MSQASSAWWEAINAITFSWRCWISGFLGLIDQKYSNTPDAHLNNMGAGDLSTTRM